MDQILVIHVSPTFAGGVGTFTRNLIEYQLNNGYKVGIITFENYNNDDRSFIEQLKGEVKVLIYKRNFITKRPMLKGFHYKRIIGILSKSYPDAKIIIHAHNPASIGLIQNYTNINLVCTLHGINIIKSFFSKYATNFILRKLERNNKKIIGVSANTTEYYNNQLKGSKIKTIYNGLNVLPTSGKNNSHFTIGYVSRIVDGKGWDLVLKSFSILTRIAIGNFKLIMCGEGNNDQVQKLKKLILNLELQDLVDYVGFIPNAGDIVVPKLDLFILPSESEGLPMSIIEALGHGVPVLATAVGGIPEVIQDGFNGRIISRDPCNIAYIIKELYLDREKYEIYRKNALYSYKTNYTLDIMGKHYDQVYKKVIIGR
jgi:glycosyltransferase involved in cell wall biosynthesis